MSSINRPKVVIVYDNREYTSIEIAPFVGIRPYGDIIYKRKVLASYYLRSLPEWAKENFYVINHPSDILELKKIVEKLDSECGICVLSSRAAVDSFDKWHQLVERLPYAEDNFTDRYIKPLLCFFKSSLLFLDDWQLFEDKPPAQWQRSWHGYECLTALKVKDLDNVQDFLTFFSGSTEARHFNDISIDKYYYTKSSNDRLKIQSEYNYYTLVPEKMQSWLVQPFDLRVNENSASYRMMRYYFADAALQWVHNAFSIDSFSDFIERLLFFVAERPRKKVEKSDVLEKAKILVIDKLHQRYNALLALESGKKINAILASTRSELAIDVQIKRLEEVFEKYQRLYIDDALVVGHGDPCFSNIIYDQHRHILKLLDPKGAMEEQELWTHPVYDLSKISHSVLGDYDFINNGLYDIKLNEDNTLYVDLASHDHDVLKPVFRDKLSKAGFDWRPIRICEASLFLSMLPLHADYPNKMLAFALTAHKILNEIEND